MSLERPRRVVIAHNRYVSTQPSGENRIVDVEVEQLRDAGVEVLPFLRSSDEIALLPSHRRALLASSLTYAPTAQRDLEQLVREHQPDVLHLHNPYPLLSPWIIRTAHRLGLPVVHTVHNYRQVCASGLYFRDGHQCTECRGRLVGWPSVQHGCYRGSRLQSVAMAGALAAHRGTWRSVERHIALTPAIAEHLRAYGVAADRIVVKPNGIPDPGEVHPVGDGFLFLGRLTPEKGIGLLVEAWERHPDGSLGPLRIAGDGELRDAVERAAARREDVKYLGQLDPAGLAEAMRASAVVLATSLWQDVLPTSGIEALAAGRPVLGTAVGGIPFIVGTEGTGGAGAGPVAGEAGWVVAPTADSLAAALPVARADAPALAPAARRRYERHFRPDVVTGQLLDVYDAVRR